MLNSDMLSKIQNPINAISTTTNKYQAICVHMLNSYIINFFVLFFLQIGSVTWTIDNIMYAWTNYLP